VHKTSEKEMKIFQRVQKLGADYNFFLNVFKEVSNVHQGCI